MGFGTKAKNYIPEGLCYELWAKKRVSLYRIPYVLRDEYNIISERTGGLITPPAAERSAWMYALEHLQEAKSDTVSIMQSSGQIFDEEAWNREVISKAQRFYSKKKYRLFLLKYPHLKKYTDG